MGAYEFVAATYAGKYIYFFTAGTDLFVLQMDGTVTKLKKLAVGINDSQIVRLASAVYPNPAEDVLTINVPKAEKVEFYNSLGTLVSTKYGMSALENQVDLSDLNQGIYSVNIYTENKIFTSSFVKK